MAFRLLCTAIKNLSLRNSALSGGLTTKFCRIDSFQSQLLKCETTNNEQFRSISFLNKTTGADLWKSCTSVSNAGKKRGRAKIAGKGLTKNLNQGQITGEGRQRLILPGLNTPVRSGKTIIKQDVDVPDPNWTEKLYRIRDQTRQKRFNKITHMERGYSGSKLAGRSVGPPEGDNFTGFDSRVIENKIVVVMRSHIGRRRLHSSFIVVGNGNGIAGFGMGKSPDPKSAVRKAKKRASQKLMHFELCDNRTVYHDFFTQFGPTKIYAYKMPEGYGLQCHRVIKTLCNLIGIQDLRTKCEGSKNPTQIVKAFLVGLLQQKPYNQLADEKKLFLVEFSANHSFFPKIVGVPSECRTVDEIPKDENLDFKQYVMGGKVPLKRHYRQESPWAKLPSYERYMKKKEKRRAWPATRLYLRARYGRLASFLTEKHPEAVSIDDYVY